MNIYRWFTQLVHISTANTGLEQIKMYVAYSFAARLTGFMFSRCPRELVGVLLPNTRSIHTFGMKFDLDVFFFNADGELVGSQFCIGRNRIVFAPKQTRYTLEVPSEYAFRPQTDLLINFCRGLDVEFLSR